MTVHSSVTVSDSCTLMSDRGLLKAGISNSMVTKAELVAEPESFVMRIVYSPRSSAVQFSIVNVMTSSSVHVTLNANQQVTIHTKVSVVIKLVISTHTTDSQ